MAAATEVDAKVWVACNDYAKTSSGIRKALDALEFISLSGDTCGIVADYAVLERASAIRRLGSTHGHVIFYVGVLWQPAGERPGLVDDEKRQLRAHGPPPVAWRAELFAFPGRGVGLVPLSLSLRRWRIRLDDVGSGTFGVWHYRPGRAEGSYATVDRTGTVRSCAIDSKNGTTHAPTRTIASFCGHGIVLTFWADLDHGTVSLDVAMLDDRTIAHPNLFTGLMDLCEWRPYAETRGSVTLMDES
jgi:hypothetical protein